MYPTDALFTEAEVFDINQLYSTSVLVWIHKNQSILAYPGHRYNTRSSNPEALRPQKSIGLKNFLYIGARLFGMLPNDARYYHARKYKKFIKNWIKERGRECVGFMVRPL